MDNYHFEIEQRSPQWYSHRLGKATASRMADLTAQLKSGGYGASRARYAGELISERLTGQVANGYISAEMQWGIDQEPNARSAYEFRSDHSVKLVGFIDHPRIAMSGASTDGLIGKRGLVSFKCPLTSTHIETLLGASIDGKYIKQMQWEMACADRDWCDFVSFDPRMPQQMQLSIQRVKRDDKMIAELERETEIFLAEIYDKITALRARFGDTQKAA